MLSSTSARAATRAVVSISTICRRRSLGSLVSSTSHDAVTALSVSHPFKITSSTERYFSSFQPPPNNTYHGAPVYKDIAIESEQVSSAAAARNNDPDAVFVVTGASRSMGLQFVKELLHRTKGKIVACVLRPGSAPALDSYLNGLGRDDRSRVDVHGLDVTNKDQIEELAQYLTSEYERVDALYNVAGILGDRINTAGPEMKLSEMDYNWCKHQMEVNAIGPMMVTSKLSPLLKARKGRNTYLRTTGAQESVVVNLSARVASMSDNTGGLAWYTYRMSKAALNSGVRASAHELKRGGTWTIALYPGMTDTDMSKPFQTQALRDKGLVFPVEFTAGRLIDVVDAMEEEHSGGMFDWAGQAIPF